MIVSTEKTLKESVGQTWHHDKLRGIYSDQFGFTILEQPENEKPFGLWWKDKLVAECYKLLTAKTLSTVLVNDIIFHKPLNGGSARTK